MADNIYIIDQLVTGSTTTTITDDGTGKDWLVIEGTYGEQTDIRLSWENAGGVATSGSGSYFGSPGVSARLIVNGFIENVRGSNGRDFIQGNEGANVLFGDSLAAGPSGGDDVIWGGAGGDTIYGGKGNDEIKGDGDNDRLFGGAGNDDISGGAGKDVIEGGLGADTMSGGATVGDTVSYAFSDAGVRIKLTFGDTTTGIGGHAAGDQLNGFTDVIGSAFNDVITDTVQGTVAFDGNKNIFNGGAGNDTLYLGGGNDRGIGGTGNDAIFGQLGNDRLEGGAGRDALKSGNGNDILDGGADNDVLQGGAGKDKLIGGAGADDFVFAKIGESTVASSGRDTITDFNRRQGDDIDLRLIDASTKNGGNQAFDFIGKGGFSGDAGELRYTVSNNGVTVLGDVNGDRKADFSIFVEDLTSLRASDFLL